MSSSWMSEEKQHVDQKVISQIDLHLSNQILQDVLKEKATCIMVKVRTIEHDEKPNK